MEFRMSKLSYGISLSLAGAGVWAALSATAVSIAQGQQPPANLGFEAQDRLSRPAGWAVNGAGYDIALDTVSPLAGRSSLRTRWYGPGTRGPQAFAVATTTYPLPLARGRALRLSGYIRTEGISEGYAGFWVRVDAGTRTIAFENMRQRGVSGTTAWTKYEVEVPVDSGASAINLGALHPGNGTAWYDSLTIQVVGMARPRVYADAAPFQAPPRIPEDTARLLTDAELAPAPDSVARPAENAAWTSWLGRNAKPIRSLGASDFSDLRFLAPLLRTKRIVQLGESGHGVAEFSLAKVRLIKYLHEELGYDVIAFESSLFECDRAQRAIATLTADQLMRSCIFGVWHAAEVRPLFEYIKSTQETARPLFLAGFDSQTSAPTAIARPAFFRDLIAKVDTAYARAVYSRDSMTLGALNGSENATAVRNRDAMVAFYDSLATWFRGNERRLAPLVRDDPFAPNIARQAAISMNAYTRQTAAGMALGTPIRDLAMADNLDFLLAERYPGKKVMVWAHNFHIQHRENVVMRDDGSTGATQTTMGVWTARRHRAELYTIGMFMYRGAAAMNGGQQYAVGRMVTGSLESMLHTLPWRYAFVDLSRATESAETAWMFRTIPTMSWGTQLDPLVPRNEYDGILFIDTSHPPAYIRGAVPR